MPRQYDDAGSHVATTIALADKTVIHDEARNLDVMFLDKAITMPVGSIVQLTDPTVDAIVVGNRLLPGDERTPAMLCIDVEVPDVWWEQVYRV